MVAPFTPKFKARTLKRFIPNVHGVMYEQSFFTWTRTGVSQKPPYVNTAMVVTFAEALNGYSDTSWSTYPEESLAATMATNKARALFVSKLGDSSSFGATLTAELKSTWGTVVSSITKALQAARAVRRGDMINASAILGFNPPTERIHKSKWRKRRKGGRYSKRIISVERWVMPDGRRVYKDLAGRWLWYSYGVKPLVDDIYNGMDVLTREHPAGTRVTASGTTENQQNVGDWYRTTYRWRSSVRISAFVRVSNPNLWLANQLGLINPVQWINEGIPFSFVIDWFSNLSQIISQMTDFVGLNIAEPLTTSKHVVDVNQFHPDYGVTMPKRLTTLRRDLVIPQAKLVFAYERFEWQRGLNAVSLLIGFLGTNSSRR